MMSLWDALRMNMMISYQELVRTFPKKAEELAKNTAVMLVKMKSGGFVAPAEKFREEARMVLRAAKRKYGSAYWYHPLLGKFQMSGGIPK